MQLEGHILWDEFHPKKRRDSDALDAEDASDRERKYVNLAVRLFARRRFVDKTPENTLRVGYLDALFPDATFVFLRRRAADNVNSLIEGWRARPRFVTHRLQRRSRGSRRSTAAFGASRSCPSGARSRAPRSRRSARGSTSSATRRCSTRRPRWTRAVARPSGTRPRRGARRRAARAVRVARVPWSPAVEHVRSRVGSPPERDRGSRRRGRTSGASRTRIDRADPARARGRAPGPAGSRPHGLAASRRTADDRRRPRRRRASGARRSASSSRLRGTRRAAAPGRSPRASASASSG